MFIQPRADAILAQTVTARSSTRTVTIVTPGGQLQARICVPAQRSQLPPLVALHGISRDAESLWEAFGALAASQGRVLVVPHFTEAAWPEFQRIGRARADLAILGILAALRDMGLNPAGKVDLFGYSGGAQLAHRFAMLYPQRIAALHLGAAGWYCLPNEHSPFPAGLGAAEKLQRRGRADIAALSLAQLDAFLRLPLRVYAGADDTERDPALRATEQIDAAQGTSRLARAKSYVLAFAAAAKARGIEPDTDLAILAGCGHDFTQCATKAGLAARVLA